MRIEGRLRVAASQFPPLRSTRQFDGEASRRKQSGADLRLSADLATHPNRTAGTGVGLYSLLQNLPKDVLRFSLRRLIQLPEEFHQQAFQLLTALCRNFEYPVDVSWLQCVRQAHVGHD